MRRTILVSLPLLILAACGEKPRPGAPAPSAPPVAVQAAAAQVRDWPAGYEATGTVRARVAGVVSAKVMGYVREVNFQVGDRVREGQLLVALDARDLETGVARAEAGIKEISSAIPEADNGVSAAKAQLDLAEVTLKRIEELAAKKSVSAQELDEARARARGARAAYQMAQAKREQLNARMAQANEERRAAEIMRGYARIHAPFAGIVTAKSVEPGNLATPGAPLATIEREGAYRLEAAVEESRLGAVKTGQAVPVTLDAVAQPLAGRVAEIVPSVDAASRSYTVKIDLPGHALLRSGMFGRAAFGMGRRQVLTIPAGALIERGQLQSVMVAEDGVARTRLVTTGRRREGNVEVLSGLAAGEKVIVPVPPALADGARVEVRP